MGVATHYFSLAAKKLGIPFSFLDSAESVLVLHFPHKDHFIVNTKLGLISNAEETLGLDKAYQYELLQDKVRMPLTKAYLDPKSKYQQFATLSTVQAIQEEIEKQFSFPVVVKRNRGSEGEHVFLVNSPTELQDKIAVIFNQQDSLYDYVLIAQQYIQPVKEYRVMIFDQKVQFAYIKDNSQATFTGNLSPLHWEKALAVDVADDVTLQKINDLCQKFFSAWKLKFAGLDIIEDERGEFWLIEVNTAPSLALYVKSCGEEKVIDLYDKIMSDIASKRE